MDLPKDLEKSDGKGNGRLVGRGTNVPISHKRFIDSESVGEVQKSV